MKKIIPKVLRTLSRYLLTIAAVLVALVVLIAGFIITIEMQLPNVEVLKDIHLQEPLRVYSREGKLIAEYGASRRIPVALEQIPSPLVKAILATEDQRFYSHPGVDFIGLFRAFKVLIGTGQKTQGASTITMQVARNFFLTHKKTYIRKLREIMLALKIERSFSKEKILELYLNKVYFGNHAYGVGAAADVYYGKTLDQLNLAEMAMIAGLPQAPSKVNPLSRPHDAILRRNHVLLRMLGTGDITKAQYQQAVHEGDYASYHGPQIEANAPYVGEMVRQFMVQEYGPAVYDQGFNVYTTISAPLQRAANRNLQLGLVAYTGRHGYLPSQKFLSRTNPDWKSAWQNELAKLRLAENVLRPAAILAVNDNHLVALLENGDSITISGPGAPVFNIGEIIWVRPVGDTWRLESFPEIEGALITLNPQNGAILALTGGFDFAKSEFNRVTQSQRQPGSAFKPFIYSAALAKGYTLASTINDAPVVTANSGEENLWRPRNNERQFYGPTRVREGLIQSRNMISIRLLQAIGIPYAINYVQQFGFDTNQLPKNLSLALGTGGTSPLKMSVAYSVFANGGYRVNPYFIDRIVGQDQQILYSAKPMTVCQDCAADAQAPLVIDPRNAYLMTQALQDVIVHGTGKAALELKRSDLAGKTGTTNDKVDAWFVGFNSQLVTAVWIGYDNLKPTQEYGSEVALEVWIDFMRKALENIPQTFIPQPSGIVTVRIDPRTGLLANSEQKNSIFELFLEGTEPHEQAPVQTSDTETAAQSTGVAEQQGDIF